MDENSIEGAASAIDTPFELAGRTYASRLIVGTGKYPNNDVLLKALEQSKCEIVYVSARRAGFCDDLQLPQSLSERFTIACNTSQCKNADDAIRIGILVAQNSASNGLIKLEIVDSSSGEPIIDETIKATKELSSKDINVMAFADCSVETAKRLQDAGAVAILPQASRIGTGKGITEPAKIEALASSELCIPIIVNAGIGSPSHVALAMELGADAVVLNTAIALADNPIDMATAMFFASVAGRVGFLSGKMSECNSFRASSPPSDL